MKHLYSSYRFAAISLAVAFAAINSIGSLAGIDKKYYGNIAEKVWNSGEEIFRPTVFIPDSVAEANSAVILAWTDDIDVDHIVQNSSFKASGQTNRMKKTHLRHVMIKLLDESAIEEYNNFEFGTQSEVKINRSLLVYRENGAFGARVHKPDGRIIEVNLDEAIEVSDKKRSGDERYYKIAVPGLEPGDVLEYFKFQEEVAESIDLQPQNVKLGDKYPVINRRMSIASHPDMTVEYKCYNGVPNLSRGKNDKGWYTASISLSNLPGVNSERYIMAYRQLPFVRIQFLNNTGKPYLAVQSRSGGLYGNIHSGKIIQELGNHLNAREYSSPVTGRALKTVKDYFLPAHPDANPREIADAAWLALNYQNMIAKNADDVLSSSFYRALSFYDILRKLKIYPEDEIGIGIINPRTDVPAHDISAWDEADFVLKTPDALYFMPLNMAIAPGEVPGTYKGETAALFLGDRKKIGSHSLVSEYTVPAKRFSENSALFRDTVSIMADDRVLVESTLKLIGGDKTPFENFTEPAEWVAEIEDYFSIPEPKRYKDKLFDAAARPGELRRGLKGIEKDLFGHEPDSVTYAAVLARGIRPDDVNMLIRSCSEFDGLVERFGSDISLKIGMLTGMPDPLNDHDRARILDIMLPCNSQETHTLLVKAPEGFVFDEKSVSALARHFNDPAIQFVADPRLTEEGDLLLSTVLRYKLADVPLSHWPNMMKVLDEAAAFADASVILIPAK